MQRYKLTIEYDGSTYAGWQKQDNAPSICAILEQAIKNFSQENVDVFGSGRTDAGVHALGQVAHFDLIFPKIEPDKITLAINFYLKEHGIIVLKTELADLQFHARFDAVQRVYKYRIQNRLAPTKIEKNRAWHVRPKLDINQMQEAANILVGRHDFSSFRASQCQAKSPVKTLDKIDIVESSNDIININVAAPSFLHHMVRNIVGSLKVVGENKMTLEKFKQGFTAKNRTLMPATAPAYGLYLIEVKYNS